MALTFNVRHLENEDLHLKGTLSPAELEMERLDEIVHASLPLTYDLNVEMLPGGILVQGRLEMTLDCECARCLRPMQHRLEIESWVCHLPTEGEDATAVLNDLVDLTPYIREDIFLALPQYPVCKPDCHDLPVVLKQPQAGQPDRGDSPKKGSSAWAALDKLKLD